MDARAFAVQGSHTALRKVETAKPIEKVIAVFALVGCTAACAAAKIYW